MFSVIEYKDWIYVIGGSSRDKYLSDVEYATVNETADFGYWGVESDALAYKAKLAARKDNQSQLTNLGTVIKVMQAEAYTYLQVDSLKQGVIWLAGPKIVVQPNSLVRYSKGVLMSGFHSKELNRTFKEILFVGQIQKAD